MINKPKTGNQFIGKLGEDLAASYITSKGYKIIDRNFQIRYGEIDLVAIDGDTLAFIEVKTRFEDDLVSPEDSMTYHKKKSLERTILFYQKLHKNAKLPELLRIDFLGIVLDRALFPIKYNLVKNIFG